jgi:hypothetical protein
MHDPVYILVRTSARPRFFDVMMKSIEAQTYPNIVTIVHTDDPGDTYVRGDVVIRAERNPDAGPGHYDLYCNTMLDAIPDGPGWYHFMDDDDMYAGDDVIETLVEHSLKTHINVGRVVRKGAKGDKIVPSRWGKMDAFQSECFFLHTSHRQRARWWAGGLGDIHYSKQLTEQLPINWIDGLLIARTQEGKGYGYRLDAGDDRPIVIRDNLVVVDEAVLAKSW